MMLEARRDGINFGALLRRWRGAKNLTQVALAEKAGVSRQLVQAYESGSGKKHSPTLESMGKIANALGVSLPQLLLGPEVAFDGGTSGATGTADGAVAIKMFRTIPRDLSAECAEKRTVTVEAVQEIGVHDSDLAFLTVDSQEMWPVIEPGDVVMFNRRRTNPRSKDIVVGFYRGEPIVRRYLRKDRKAFLLPDNPTYPEIELVEPNDFVCVGTVVSSSRRYPPPANHRLTRRSRCEPRVAVDTDLEKRGRERWGLHTEDPVMALSW